jgi:hypothetical protein
MTDIRAEPEAFVATGYTLVAWPRSTGKGPRGEGWGLAPVALVCTEPKGSA